LLHRWAIRGLDDLHADKLRLTDAAAFRYAKSLLHKVERAVGLETDTSEILNECIMAVKKFGTIRLVF
jgi:hypothetical protein